MKYDIKAKVFGIVFTKMLKKYYSEHDLGIDLKPYIKPLKKEYRAIVERTPGLAKGSIVQDNLTGASYFFAMAKVIPNMTPELMDRIVDDSMHSELMLKMHRKDREKGTLFTDKVQDQWVKAAEKSQTSEYEMDWKFTYEKHPDEYYMTYTKCGVCRLAEREGVLDYLPCMCKMDFPKYEMKGAELERTKTLANGDECCNFHVIRMK